LNIDFKEVVINSEGVVGSDGRNVKITIGSRQNNVTVSVWSPGYNTQERKMDVIYELIKEVFIKTGLEEWL
jgi:hypothetical protein